MTQTLLFLIGATILLVVVSVLGRGTIVRVYGVVTGQTKRKNKNKEKVLALLRKQPDGVSNEDIREALGVSAATVVRYMDELEQEEKVEQVGSVGHAVTYRLKPNTSTG